MKPIRRFTLLDATILVAATTVGFWLARTFLLLPSHEPDWRHRFGASYLVLLSVHVGVFLASLIPPRPALRRQARRPGFLAGVTVAVWVSIQTINFLVLLVSRRLWGGDYRRPGSLVNDFLLEISGPFHLAPVILLAWCIGGMQGFWWRGRDWAESSGRLLGVVWIVNWLVLLGLRPFVW